MKSAARRAAAWAVVTAVLGLVATAYLSPHLMVDLANRVWACF
jgi:hypothetical protein